MQYHDVVEAIIPSYRLACPDKSGAIKENFVSKQIEVAYKDKTHKAVAFRHSYRTSLLVLGGMLTGLILLVMGTLLKRDSDPQ